MKNFYDEWLAMWDRGVEERRRARRVINEDELTWARTRQDARSALLIAPETGFRTAGGVTMLAEIPPGWKTGKHSHGEEAIYVLSGKGFSIVDDQKYEWEEGACMHIPYGSAHQHFNAGSGTVRYFSALAPHFENYCMFAKFQQFEDCGEASGSPSYSKMSGDHDAQGRRIVLNRKDAVVNEKGEDTQRPVDAFRASMAKEMNRAQHGKQVKMMGGYPDFIGSEVEITDVFVDGPRTSSQKHAHGEAFLYVLKGEGYTIIDGEKVPWKTGSAIHIPGPQTVHQHFYTSYEEVLQLRTHFGVRKFMQPLTKAVFPYVYLEEGKPL